MHAYASTVTLTVSDCAINIAKIIIAKICCINSFLHSTGSVMY